MHRRGGGMLKASPHQIRSAHSLLLIHNLQLLHSFQMLQLLEDVAVPGDEGEGVVAVADVSVSLLCQESLVAILVLTLVVYLMYGGLLL
uniref:Uncharacterized protein n=1 Tax=Brassica oleracea TaxID=3712 RepID=A0A3P6C2I0_BRAOL|nr:unnamed protein product [Brassica oleracea]